MDCEKKNHPILDINGVIESGKQFDLEIVLPDDHKSVIFGVVKDCHRCPIKDAVVKLIEVKCEKGKTERCPVTHTFTNKEGEFVFGPLCEDKFYELQIFVNNVKHIKICAAPKVDRECLECCCLEKCDFILEDCCKEEMKDCA